MAKSKEWHGLQLPYEQGHPEDLIVWVLGALIGSIIGASLMRAYRTAAPTRTP